MGWRYVSKEGSMGKRFGGWPRRSDVLAPDGFGCFVLTGEDRGRKIVAYEDYFNTGGQSGDGLCGSRVVDPGQQADAAGQPRGCREQVAWFRGYARRDDRG